MLIFLTYKEFNDSDRGESAGFYLPNVPRTEWFYTAESCSSPRQVHTSENLKGLAQAINEKVKEPVFVRPLSEEDVSLANETAVPLEPKELEELTQALAKLGRV